MNDLTCKDDDVIATKLCEVSATECPNASDYLTANCHKKDEKGNCEIWHHYCDTPGVDQPEV